MKTWLMCRRYPLLALVSVLLAAGTFPVQAAAGPSGRYSVHDHTGAITPLVMTFKPVSDNAGFVDLNTCDKDCVGGYSGRDGCWTVTIAHSDGSEDRVRACSTGSPDVFKLFKDIGDGGAPVWEDTPSGYLSPAPGR